MIALFLRGRNRGGAMTEQKVEDFVRELDRQSTELGVYPDRQTFDCCDCYLCRVDFFKKVRTDLRKE